MKSAFATLVELADDLTEPTRTPVRIDNGWTKSRNKAKPTLHWVMNSGLLAQLYEAATEPVVNPEGFGSTNKPESKPPVEIPALCAYNEIVIAARRWVLSLKMAPRETPESNIRALIGIASKFDIDTLEALLLEVRQWHRQASVFTGTTSRPFQPRITCPICDSRYSIWINVEKEIAFCKECSTDWVGGEIGDLATLVNKLAA